MDGLSGISIGLERSSKQSFVPVSAMNSVARVVVGKIFHQVRMSFDRNHVYISRGDELECRFVTAGFLTLVALKKPLIFAQEDAVSSYDGSRSPLP